MMAEKQILFHRISKMDFGGGGESYQSDGATYMVEVTYRQGVCLNGRFGNFEYWNMDRILRESKNLSERLREGK